MRTELLLGLVSFAATGLLPPTIFGAEPKLEYAVAWATAGGSVEVSTGGVFSVSRTVGSRETDLIHGPSYTVSGSPCAGVMIVPQSATDGFYVGIDLHDPAQARADFDRDGYSNLIEFALGADPWTPMDNGNLPLLWASRIGGDLFVTMQFKRRANAAALGLHYVPEVSEDGQTWYSDATHILQLEVMPINPYFDWVTVRDQTSATADAPRFFRLRVTQD